MPSFMPIRLLGPVGASVEGRPVALGAAKQRALLAVLALQANRAVSADELIEALWGEQPPASAPKMLQQHVSQLRKLLDGSGNGHAAEILTRGRGYELSIAPDDVDAGRFERLVANGAGREALALWYGPALADIADEPFAAAAIRQLEELRLSALERAIDADLADGRHRDLVGELEALVAEHPLSERLHGQLMLALYRSGRQAEALEAYRVTREMLVEQIGIEPGPQLRRLHEAILRQEAAVDSPATAELPQELEATSPLVGRVAELERLRAAWAQARGGHGGAVVLSGPAGIGRRRLAAELAGEVHRQGGLVLYGADAIARAHATRRPTLLVLEDVDDAGAGALASDITDRPLLCVVTGADAGPTEPLPGAERLALGPLGPDEVTAIAALYAPDGAKIPTAELAARSGGVPQRAHRLAAEWARAEAVRRLGPLADRTAADRSDLRLAERALAGDVADVQGVRTRAELHEADRRRVVCPFKGLASFDVADAGFFFGRERLVAEMVARLVGSPLLGVLGPSGSGKSSAVRAGLLAELADGVLPGSDRWTQVLLRPGEHPLAALERATASIAPDARVLVAVDQFEELFTLCREEQERTAFVSALLAAAGDPGRQAIVVLAIRADFYGRCAAYPGLARLLGANQVLVGPMQAAELRRVIELPARRAGLLMEPALVDRLLADVDAEPGALPLLSTALLELWQRRDGRCLRLAHSAQTGGVRGAVARLAEAAYGRLEDDHRAVARRILLRLAGDDTGGAPVRRRIPLQELDAEHDDDARRVLDALADSRLVTVSEGSVEVAHEALLREWPRLRGWLDEDAEGRRLLHHLAIAARDWQAGGRDPGELYRGARLASTLDWAAAHQEELNATERAFVATSHAQSEAEMGQARRTNQRLRALLGAVLALLALAGGVGALFFGQRGEARDQARTADARHLGAQALVEENLDRALLLARQGVDLEGSVETRGNLLAALMRSPAAIGVTRVGRGRLNGLAMRPDGRALVVGDEHGNVSFLDPPTGRELRPPFDAQTPYIRQLVFNPSGSRLAVGGFGVIRLLDGRTFRELAELDVPAPDLQFINVAFSPDGRVLVAMHGDSTNQSMLRFDGRTGRSLGRPASFAAPAGLADVAAFTPDGRGFITVARDPRALAPAADPAGDLGGGDIVVRDSRTLRPLRRYAGFAWAGALSPDGRTFAAGSADGSVRFVDLRSGEQRRALGRHNAAVTHASFTPDGRFLVTAGEDSNAIVWDVEAAEAGETLEGHTGRVAGLALDRRGRTLFTAAADGTVITWDLVGDRRLGRPFDAGSGSDSWPSTAISRDGRRLVTATDDGAVSVVDTRTLRRRRLAIADGPVPGTPSAPAFGPPGTLIVSSVDGFVARVDARTGRVTGRFAGHRDSLFAPTTSADGRIVVTGGFDGTVRLWDARSLRQLGRPIPFWLPNSTYAISPDGSRVAVTVVAGTIDVLDVGSRRRLARLRVDDSDVVASGFSRDGRLLLAGSQDGRVRVFSVRDWSAVGPAFLAHAGFVTSVDISRDGRTIVSAGNDGQVRLWDAARRRPIGAPLPGPKHVNVVAQFAPSGEHVFAIFANGRGYRWDARPSAWTRHACEVADRRLTREEWSNALPDRDYAPAC